MSDTARDPRTDPRPRDVVSGGGATYEVTEVREGHVHYRMTFGDHIPLDGWRRIVRDARVVARGAERSEP